MASVLIALQMLNALTLYLIVMSPQIFASFARLEGTALHHFSAIISQETVLRAFPIKSVPILILSATHQTFVNHVTLEGHALHPYSAKPLQEIA
jgi:hypothetical protein